MKINIAKVMIGEEEKKSVLGVLESGMLAQGAWVKRFEGEFASFNGSSYAAACCNGTAALDIALKAIGIKEGDEVIVPDFTFIASANAIRFQGAKPVFADVRPDTFNIDPKDLEKKLTKKTKAIMPVHLYGQAADMKGLQKISEGAGIPIIEDACQAHGASWNGKKVGGFGTMGAFSFYPTKNMTTGEGGLVTTENAGLDAKIRMLRDQGQKEKYVHTELGYNLRMTDIAASIGVGQLERLEANNKKRRENAAVLTAGIKKIKGLTPPFVAEGNEHVYHQYVIRVEDDFALGRDELMKKLAEKSIGSAVHYPIPVHRQPYYQGLGYKDVKCPVSADLAGRVLSLPVHPGLAREELDYIVAALKEASP